MPYKDKVKQREAQREWARKRYPTLPIEVKKKRVQAVRDYRKEREMEKEKAIEAEKARNRKRDAIRKRERRDREFGEVPAPVRKPEVMVVGRYGYAGRLVLQGGL